MNNGALVNGCHSHSVATLKFYKSLLSSVRPLPFIVAICLSEACVKFLAAQVQVMKTSGKVVEQENAVNGKFR